jgi:hypothetical protein
VESQLLAAQDAVVKRTVGLMEAKAAQFSKAMQVGVDEETATCRVCTRVTCKHVGAQHVQPCAPQLLSKTWSGSFKGQTPLPDVDMRGMMDMWQDLTVGTHVRSMHALHAVT